MLYVCILTVICLFLKKSLFYVIFTFRLMLNIDKYQFSALFLVEGGNKNLCNSLFISFPYSFVVLAPYIDYQIFTPLPPLSFVENGCSLYPMGQCIITLSYFYFHGKSTSVTVDFSEVI